MSRRDLDAVKAELRSRDYRITKPRMTVAAALAASKRYVTARELHRRLERGRAGVGLATVYRTLETLQQVGAASARPLERGEMGYLYCGSAHHHHAVCTSCGTVEDVPCAAATGFERALAAGFRFRVVRHDVAFFGLCARCS